MSKGNYGSRKGYSIDDLTLGKRLLHDCIIQNIQPTMHGLIDLQCFYDRQLANACRLVEEVSGAER